MAQTNRIRDVIKQRQAEFPEHYSPPAIAKRLGVHLITVYKWEGGAGISSENLLRLAQDLHVPVETLRTYAPEPLAEPAPTA